MEIIEIFEIFLSIVAVFGGYCILDMVKLRLLYPKGVRRNVRGAVIFRDIDDLNDTVRYIRYLQKENKISSERLIILVNDDIINGNENFSELYRWGEVFKYNECKELCQDDELRGGREKSRNDRRDG